MLPGQANSLGSLVVKLISKQTRSKEAQCCKVQEELRPTGPVLALIFEVTTCSH